MEGESPSMPAEFQFRISSLFIATFGFSVLMAGLVLVRKPIYDAMRIHEGDSFEQVHDVLGDPSIVFNSDAELRASKFTPQNFAFSVVIDAELESPVSKLPAIKRCAEWFKHTQTTGHLVYYDANGVEVVFWGRW